MTVKPLTTNDADWQSLIDVIRDIIPDELRSVDIVRETSLEDLGFDSIRYMHLLLSLPDIVGLEVDEVVKNVQLSSFKTVGDIHDTIRVMKTN